MRRLWARYVAGDPALSGLLLEHYATPSWEAVRRRKAAFPYDRSRLVAALERQNAPFLATYPALRGLLEALRQPTTFTITTGQQLGWLTGPLYTIIKALHTCQLAQQVEATLNGRYRVVPIFWLASEDHDAEEVREIALSWTQRLRYAGYFQGPVGRHIIEAAFPEAAQSLALQRFWQAGLSWEMAFRSAFYALFEGRILLVSGDDPELKALAASLWVREVEEQLTLHSHRLACAYLRRIGERPLLASRAVNLFWLSDTERRYPTPEEEALLRRAAHAEPHRLSPNVLLRPLYQEYLLPNLAYLAGPAEVAYWIELMPTFSAFGVPPPLIYPRGHLRVLPATALELPSDWALPDLWRVPFANLRRALAEAWGSDEVEQLMAWWRQHRPPLENLQGRPFLRHTLRLMERFWQKWGEKLRQAALRATYTQKAEAIQEILAYRLAVEPPEALQERTLNVHAFSEDPITWVQKLGESLSFQPAQWHYWITPEPLPYLRPEQI
ncbi:MAG: bacillithiol biosynthesis BshC [Bacteroidia bacterium]